jgi:hypothetical protein
MMMREQRAKQFMPFDAMKGLAEALKDREEKHSRVPKHGISDEKKQELSETLIRVEKGSKVFVEYYANFHDREKSGIVTEINRPYQFLRLDEEKILFTDLYDIRVVG